MRITVIVKPKKSVASVEVVTPSHFIVQVKEPPVDGRANAGVISTIARHFNISPNEINIISGYSSRMKTIEISDELHGELFPSPQTQPPNNIGLP